MLNKYEVSYTEKDRFKKSGTVLINATTEMSARAKVENENTIVNSVVLKNNGLQDNTQALNTMLQNVHQSLTEQLQELDRKLATVINSLTTVSEQMQELTEQKTIDISSHKID